MMHLIKSSQSKDTQTFKALKNTSQPNTVPGPNHPVPFTLMTEITLAYGRICSRERFSTCFTLSTTWLYSYPRNCKPLTWYRAASVTQRLI